MLGRDEYFELLILAGAEVSYPNANGESAFVSGNKHQQNLITRCCKLAYKNIIHDIPGCETDKETSIFEKIKNGFNDYFRVPKSCISGALVHIFDKILSCCNVFASHSPIALSIENIFNHLWLF